MASFFDDEDELKSVARPVVAAGLGLSAAVIGITTSIIQGRAGLSSAISGLGTVLGIGIAAPLAAFGLSIRSATSAMSEFARTAASMRANTGMSYGQAGNLINRNMAFGIGASDTAQMVGNNPVLSQMRGQMFGTGSHTDPRYLSNMASNYQGMANEGPMGRLMANRILDMQSEGGKAPDSVRALVNLPQNKINAQLDWQQNAQSKLGVTPGMIRAFAEDIPLLQNRLSSLWNMIKVRFAGELAPFFEKMLGGVTDYLSNNADKIAGAIKTAARWLVVEAPAMVMHFAAGVLGAFGHFLKGGATFLHFLAANAGGILKVFDVIINGLRSFGIILAGIATGILQLASNVGNSPVGKWMTGKLGLDPNNKSTATVAGAAVTVAGTVAGAAAIKAGLKWAWRGITGAPRGGGGSGGRFVTGIPAIVARAAMAIRMGAPAIAAGGGPLLLVGAAGLASGAAVGYGAYKLAQRAGLVDKTQSFTNRMAAGWGRLRDAVTGNSGHYDRTVQQQAQQQATAQAQAQTAHQQAMTKAQASPLSAFAPRDGRSLSDAFREGRAGFDGLVPQSSLEKTYSGSLSSFFSDKGDSMGRGGDSLLKMSDSLNKGADNWRTEMLKMLKGIEGNTGKTADNTGKTAEKGMIGFGETVSRIGSYIAEDSYLNLTRVN